MVAIAAAASAFDPLAAVGSHDADAERHLVRHPSAAAPSIVAPLRRGALGLTPPSGCGGPDAVVRPGLVRLSGTADPDGQDHWLFDPAHNAAMVAVMWDGRHTFAAWPQDVSGGHRPHMEAAAVAGAL